MFQLYTAYVESQEQLQLERLENKRVNKYLDDIVQEVEAKAPILKRQRDEHERMQKSVASLSAKLEQAVKVCNFGQLTESGIPYRCFHRITFFVNTTYFNILLYMCFFKEVHRLQKEADDANKRSSVLERESQRCELQLGDMAQQVGQSSAFLLCAIQIFKRT